MSSSNYKHHVDEASPLTTADSGNSANNRNGPPTKLENQTSAGSLASSSASQNSNLLNAYNVLEYTTLDLGNDASIEEIQDRYEKLCEANCLRQERLAKFDMALQVIRSERSIGAKLQSYFLNWTSEERRLYILSATFWIALSLLFVFVGAAPKVYFV